ncbi:MAG TPA: hypothetical protein VH158_00330 [Gemmatimonadales bacterium]|nr:hypothetical protein [Gemmatimonadales bacterium]
MRDIIPPTIHLSTSADTQQIATGLSFTVTATDNLALNDIQLTYSGGFIAQTDTVFTNQTLVNYTQSVNLSAGQLGGAGGLITIAGRATDGAGNTSVDTLRILLVNIAALKVVLVQPSPGAVSSPGKYVPVQVIATQRSGVKRVGWTVTPAGKTAVLADSIINPGPPFPDSVNFVDSVLVTGNTGTFTVVGFAVDSGGRRAFSSQVTVSILSAANDVTPPEIQQFVPHRAEALDTITVHATDPSGISVIGFRVTDSTGTVLLHQDSLLLSGTSTDVTHTFPLGLVGILPPARVIVQAFACDASVNHNCGVSGQVFTIPSPTGAARTDTILIVAGQTHPLPAGGSIADAIYNTNRRELYLTNQTLGRVDVFSLTTQSFALNGILTAGPQPFGIALWPADTLGNYDPNKVVVADAGGTELSILDASTRLLLWRQALPNYLIERYQIIVGAGGVRGVITIHDVSDRPQYVGTVCRVTTGSATCAADSIYAIYSTTPTQSSNSPFNGRATLRMEKLINSTDTTQLFGHFFWEIGALGQQVSGDTLRIELIRPAQGQRKVTLTACATVTIDFSTFGLGDQTFVRNTGNFTHGFIGEGGNISTPFARVFAYSAKKALVTPTDSCMMGTVIPESGTDDRDFGASPGTNVSDFISNTGVKVVSVATNFNGLTNLVRASSDSIYYLDQGLRLWGTSGIKSQTAGMDMNYNHNFEPGSACSPTCGGTGSTGNRIVFAASTDTAITAFDTYFFNVQAHIPIRDPIVGPLRVALDVGTNQQYLFAITTRGLVVVTLPPITNGNPQARPGWRPLSAPR